MSIISTLAPARRRDEWLIAAHYWLRSAANFRLLQNRPEWERCWQNTIRCWRTYREMR